MRALSILLNQANCPNLKSLRLSWNDIGPQGVKHVADSTNFQNLTTLVLSENHIGDEGLGYFAEAKSLENLESLDLRNNKVTDQGAIALSKSNKFPKTSINRLDW